MPKIGPLIRDWDSGDCKRQIKTNCCKLTPVNSNETSETDQMLDSTDPPELYPVSKQSNSSPDLREEKFYIRSVIKLIYEKTHLSIKYNKPVTIDLGQNFFTLSYRNNFH